MSDIFVNEEKEEIVEKMEKKKEKTVPPEYLKVRLSSRGKLTVPEVLHIRDYTGEDALKLASSNENNILSTLISVVQNMIWEPIDPSLLHEKELEELMLNVYLNFWNSSIRDYPFPYTEEEWMALPENKKARIESGEESLTVDIDISKLNTVVISKQFEEPITIIDNKDSTKVEFRLPRIKDFFVTQEYLEKKYYETDIKFKSFESLLRSNEKLPDSMKKSIDPTQLAEYKEYIESKAADFLRVKQAQLLLKHGSKVLSSLDEKMTYLKKISFKMWNAYNKVLTDYAEFGVDHDVEMKSPIDGSDVKRRCLFQFVDFIPSSNLQQFDEFTIQFGNK